jgi:hypothetical protein
LQKIRLDGILATEKAINWPKRGKNMKERRQRNGVAKDEDEVECEGHIDDAETNIRCKLICMSMESAKQTSQRLAIGRDYIMNSVNGRRRFLS